MAIKVKHEGNVTSRITAAARGGRGKRAAEDGKAWAQIAAGEAQAANRQLQGAHASPVAPGHASAQLTHAPTGAAPGIMHAPSGGVHGRGGGGGGRSGTGAGTSAGDSTRRLKVTGTSIFTRPDKESVWDQNARQWVREYLPGEWEAEAQQRIGDVKNAQQMELAEHKAGLERQGYEYKLSTQQKSEIAKINNALDEARRSGRFSDDELVELERQADAKRLGIQPLPTPREKVPDPIIRADAQGREWLNNGGKWESVDAIMAKGRKDDFAKLMKLVPETRTEMKVNPATGKEEPVEVPLSPEERMAELEKYVQMRDRYAAGMAGTPAPGGEVQPDPLTQAFQNYMGFWGMGAGQPTAPVQPVQPAAPAPQEPSEVEKKWSAFKGR